MKLSVSRLDDTAPAWIEAELERRVAAIANGVGRDDASVEMILVDDAYITRINGEFRNNPTATDVISFSYLEEDEIFPDDANIAGEIYISYETIEREAKQRGLDRVNLFLRIAVHGLLHVLGHDHLDDAGTAAMEAEERNILAGLLSDEEIEPLFA